MMSSISLFDHSVICVNLERGDGEEKRGLERENILENGCNGESKLTDGCVRVVTIPCVMFLIYGFRI